MAIIDLLVLIADLSRRPKVAISFLVGIILAVASFYFLPKGDYKIWVFLGAFLLSVALGLVWHLETESET